MRLRRLWIGCAMAGWLMSGCAAGTASEVSREALVIGGDDGYAAVEPDFVCVDPPVPAFEGEDDFASPTRPSVDSSVVDAIAAVRTAGGQPRLSFYGDPSLDARIVRVDTVDEDGQRQIATFLRSDDAPVLLAVTHEDGSTETLVDLSAPTRSTTLTRSGSSTTRQRSTSTSLVIGTTTTRSSALGTSIDSLTTDPLARAASHVELLDGLDFPWQMPAIRFPDFRGCSDAELRTSVRAWALAHHHAWRAWQLFEYLAANPEEREALWAAGYDPDADWLTQLGFRVCLGEYWGSDFTAIRGVVNDIWQRMKNAEVGDIDMRFRCTPDEGGNVCNTVGPVAHHWMVGWLNACGDFYAAGWSDEDRADILLHEMLHHGWVEWVSPDGYAHDNMLVDNHIYPRGEGCGVISSRYLIDIWEVRELADTDACINAELRLRNVESYARMITTFGRAVLEERIQFYPTVDSDSQPPPTETCGAGDPDAPERDTDEPCVKIGQQMYCYPTGDGGIWVAGDDCLITEPISDPT